MKLYSQSTVNGDVEETKDTFINGNDLKHKDINNAPGPAVIDNEYKSEDSKGKESSALNLA